MVEQTHIDDLLPFYVMGSLDAQELAMVETHLAQCARCQALLQELQVTGELVPYATTPVQPSPLLKQKLLARVDADLRSPKPMQKTFWHTPFADWLSRSSPAFALASLILLLVALGWLVNLRTQVDELHAQNQTLTAQLNQNRQALEFLRAPNVVEFKLQGTSVQPNARGQLFTNPSQTQALLLVSGLQPLPLGRVYQVWLIKDKTPIGVGTLVTDTNGNGQLIINAPNVLGTFQITALTQEPEGGSPLPTTDIVMAGQF